MADSIHDRVELIVQDIQNVSTLGPSFVYDVWKMLESFGYVIQPGDEWLLGFCIQKVNSAIKNKCNILEIPQNLKKLAAQMIAGEFFLAKKGMGQLKGFSIDFDAAAKQIKEGDTTVQFAINDGSSTPEQRLDKFIAYLLRDDEPQFAKYRQVVW